MLTETQTIHPNIQSLPFAPDTGKLPRRNFPAMQNIPLLNNDLNPAP